MKPPFTGSIEFKLAIRALDERVIRLARVSYTYTPPWPYYHARSHKEQTGTLRLDLGLTLLAIPRQDRKRNAPTESREPYWVPLGQLLTVGVLRAKVYDQLLARIDNDALDMDRENRIAAGQSVPALPERI